MIKREREGEKIVRERTELGHNYPTQMEAVRKRYVKGERELEMDKGDVKR